MKIIKILGGLGNQMFQYALYIALKYEFADEIVKVDCSYFSTYHVHNGLELERVFGLPLPQASFAELVRVTVPVRWFTLSRFIRRYFPRRKTECLEAKDYTFNEDVFTPGDKYYDGYWQNYRYFEKYLPVIRNEFSFKLLMNEKTRSLLNVLLTMPDSVSIHVRRGDYLKSSRYRGLCGLDYYTAAIAYIKERISEPKFFIFSDDIEWCRVNIAPLLGDDPFDYVDWNHGTDSPLDMQLMASCHFNIIANSSFSWWAAALNAHTDKIVCAPRKWTNTNINYTIQMPDWVLF